MIVYNAYLIEKLISRLNNHKLNIAVWHVLRFGLNLTLPFYFLIKPKTHARNARDYVEREVILSLTSFPDRISSLPLVLETLFHQTVKPDRLILWLAESQFPDKKILAKQFHKFIKMGLEIKYCDDLKSHKKYYYSMKENPNSIVITCDDDILYPENMIESLLTKHLEYPDCVITCRGHEMVFSNGVIQPYCFWEKLAGNSNAPDSLLCATGGAGCLYPPGSLSEHVFDKDVFSSLCLYADDIWMKCMEVLVNTKVVLTQPNPPEIITVYYDKKGSLASFNVINNQNDNQLKAVTNYYHIDWQRIIADI